jgi:hypothetical protein
MASGDRGARRATGLIGCLLIPVALTTAAAGPEEAAPDIELLAYLGSWPGTDEEWVAVAEWDGKTETEAPAKPKPGEEKDDE